MLKFKPGDYVIVAQKDFFDNDCYGLVGYVLGSTKPEVTNVYFPEFGTRMLAVTMLERISKDEYDRLLSKLAKKELTHVSA